MMPINPSRLPRLSEYKALFFRIGLAFGFYMAARVLFWLYNSSLIEVSSVFEFAKLAWHGLAFDTTAILYVNALFIVLSVLPTGFNATPGYQRMLKILYLATNLTAYALNFVDFIYYRFTFSRTTMAVMDSLEHEQNKAALFGNFLVNYWHVFALFVLFAWLWIWSYGRIRVKDTGRDFSKTYFGTSLIALLMIATLCVGGIRGDFKKSTRPINLVDASRHVRNPAQADIVLNTPFAFFRTLGIKTFKRTDYIPQDLAETLAVPYKQYGDNEPSRPNVVIFILESYGREYIASFNKEQKIPGYKGYSPFVDSLAAHSLIFTNAYANGHKSIHGMSSIMAGIPSFREAFTSSPYAKPPIESLVSVLKSEGYTTSFYHGAPNGSMGFLGFANILGVENYYGKTEFGDDSQFDGVWGIWDEPFFQYFCRNLGKEKQPFFSTIFTVSSHEPYKVPAQYEGKFPEGDVNIHKTIGYTDHALRRFFASAQKQPWFNNTIFVLVADHGNTIFYDEYKKEFMKNTVPILFYWPGSPYKGVNHDLAQQIDIYPTILDMIGYDKPFRSWGRSLLGDYKVDPFVIKYSANQYQYFSGDYICTFDGKKATGFYAADDKGMERNLLNARTPKMDSLELRCKALVQDYMYRITQRKLGPK